LKNFSGGDFFHDIGQKAKPGQQQGPNAAPSKIVIHEQPAPCLLHHQTPEAELKCDCQDKPDAADCPCENRRRALFRPLDRNGARLQFENMATLTKITRSGNAQMLRIPPDYHLASKEVEIHRTGGGLLILDPAERQKTMDALLGIMEKPARFKKEPAGV
jgi:virulence-associated protein VagC